MLARAQSRHTRVKKVEQGGRGRMTIPLLTPAEAAAILHVSEKTLRRQHGSGLNHVRVGKQIRYRPDDLQDYIKANTCHSAQKTRATGTTTSRSGVVDFMDRVARKTSKPPKR